MYSIQQDYTAQNWEDEDTESMGRYDGFTLKKKIRDSRTDEAPHVTTLEHASVLDACRPMQEVSSVTESPRNPSRQGCTPMKTAHPFNCTPVAKVLFYKKKSLQILLFYPISILSSKVKHNGSIHKYTQLVMLTHYSHLKG